MESKDSDNIIDPESVLTLDYIPADLFQKTNKNITKNNSNNNSKKLSKINESNTNSSKTEMEPNINETNFKKEETNINSRYNLEKSYNLNPNDNQIDKNSVSINISSTLNNNSYQKNFTNINDITVSNSNSCSLLFSKNCNNESNERLKLIENNKKMLEKIEEKEKKIYNNEKKYSKEILEKIKNEQKEFSNKEKENEDELQSKLMSSSNSYNILNKIEDNNKNEDENIDFFISKENENNTKNVNKYILNEKDNIKECEKEETNNNNIQNNNENNINENNLNENNNVEKNIHNYAFYKEQLSPPVNINYQNCITTNSFYPQKTKIRFQLSARTTENNFKNSENQFIDKKSLNSSKMQITKSSNLYTVNNKSTVNNQNRRIQSEIYDKYAKNIPENSTFLKFANIYNTNTTMANDVQAEIEREKNLTTNNFYAKKTADYLKYLPKENHVEKYNLYFNCFNPEQFAEQTEKLIYEEKNRYNISANIKNKKKLTKLNDFVGPNIYDEYISCPDMDDIISRTKKKIQNSLKNVNNKSGISNSSNFSTLRNNNFYDVKNMSDVSLYQFSNNYEGQKQNLKNTISNSKLENDFDIDKYLKQKEELYGDEKISDRGSLRESKSYKDLYNKAFKQCDFQSGNYFEEYEVPTLKKREWMLNNEYNSQYKVNSFK